MTKPCEHRGFTLVELLVVVAILALLLAILLPALSKAKFNARLAVCMSNLRQITVGSATYATEFGGYYPEDEEEGMRKQSYANYPEPLADYVGGSVRYATNATLRCPELAANGIGGRTHYQLYYTFSGSLKSGATSVSGSHATPNEPDEAMPRMGTTRITEGNSYYGGGNWESTIIASDIAQEWSQYIGSGHFKDGASFRGGYGPLGRWWRPESHAIANYAFDDGHVERHSFSNSNRRQVMMAGSSRGAGDWDKFLLPRDAIRQVP